MKVKFLSVIYPEAMDNTHVYVAKCTDSLKADVNFAIDKLEEDTKPNEVDEIVRFLKRGTSYWLNEHLCFEIIELDM